jgi:hypothetical protein
MHTSYGVTERWRRHRELLDAERERRPAIWLDVGGQPDRSRSSRSPAS